MSRGQLLDDELHTNIRTERDLADLQQAEETDRKIPRQHTFVSYNETIVSTIVTTSSIECLECCKSGCPSNGYSAASLFHVVVGLPVQDPDCDT